MHGRMTVVAGVLIMVVTIAEETVINALSISARWEFLRQDTTFQVIAAARTTTV
jgi:hypothetical protein